MESHVAVMLTYVMNVSVSHVSQCGFRTGAGQTSDQRRGGVTAATCPGHEQRGCRAGTHTNTHAQRHMPTWQSMNPCLLLSVLTGCLCYKFADNIQYICGNQLIIFQKIIYRKLWVIIFYFLLHINTFPCPGSSCCKYTNLKSFLKPC